MKDFTIIVNSCDKYEDAWDPFFKLLKLQWPECSNYEIILNSETKVYNCDFLNVKTICGGKNITWSTRLKNVLKSVDSKLVVFLLEDFFLKSPVNQKDFLEIVDRMLKEDIGYVGLKYRPDRLLKDNTSPKEKLVERDNLPVNLRLPLISSMWNRKYFIRILRNHESPWDFEHYAGIRSKRYKMKVLDANNNQGFYNAIFDYDIDMQYGIGIAKGKWLMPKTKEFLDSYGLNVNYDNLGVDNETYYRAIGVINDQPKTKPEFVVEKITLIESLYRIKKAIITLPTKLKNAIKKIKSLI